MSLPLAHIRATLRGLSRRGSHNAGTAAMPAGGERGALLDSAFLRQIARVRFADPRAATDGLTGEHISNRRAHAVEFADYRSYVPGDDIRLVDWNVYARLGELCVRLGRPHENLRVHLLLDCSASMDWGQPNKLLYARRVAAALGALALVGYDTVHLGAWHSDLYAASPPLRGRQALVDMLRYLESLRPGPATDPARAMAAYCASHRGSGIAVLLTDCLVSSGYAAALAQLAAAGLRTTLLHILDAREQQPDLEGPLELRDCETGEVVKVGITPEVLRRYAAQLRAWTDELAALCKAQQAHYVQVSTAVAPTTLILQTLRRQGVLQ